MPIRNSSTPAKSGSTKTVKVKKVTNTKKNDVDLLSQIKINLKFKNENQKKLSQSIKNNDVTICTGVAGTGKTLISVAEALNLLKTNSDTYSEIKLVKSIVQLRDEDIGTLPGDANEKLKFMMMSFLDSFYKLIGQDLTDKLITAGYIKLEVFGSIRGRSLSNCIVLFDEFQNVTDNNGKTLLTRFAENTKVVVLGDSNQIDIKVPEKSCLAELVKIVKAIPEEGVGVVEFSENDVVRHRLTKYFMSLFEHKDYKKIPEKKEKKILLKEEPKKETFFQKLIK